jgi:catechol 2,3-dioxygenase-like lactoylglutathione lyase family enzyme
VRIAGTARRPRSFRYGWKADIGAGSCYRRSVAGNTIQITPFMHVADVASAVRFFTEILGFRATSEMPGYAYVEREGAGIRVQGHSEPSEIGSAHGGFAYYVDVRNLDTVLEEIGPKLAKLPEGAVFGPVDQGYGQRELMIRAPDGNLVVFGQAIDSE